MSDARAEMDRAGKLGLDTSTLDRTVRMQTFFLLGEPNEVQTPTARSTAFSTRSPLAMTTPRRSAKNWPSAIDRSPIWNDNSPFGSRIPPRRPSPPRPMAWPVGSGNGAAERKVDAALAVKSDILDTAAPWRRPSA